MSVSSPAQEENIKFFKKHYLKEQPILTEYRSIKILKGKHYRTEMPVLYIWAGKQKDPYIKYSYRTEERMESDIEKFKKRVDERDDYKEERKKAKREFVPEFEVGDIFVGSWGYEQTNVDAYQVIEKPSAHFAVIRAIGFEYIDSVSSMACNVKPVKDSFLEGEEPMKKKVETYGISINSCITASKWDGKRSFYNSWYA